MLVSDDLASYQPAAEKLGLSHQLCLAHARKALALCLKKLEGCAQAQAVIRQALKELTPAAQSVLQKLHRHFVRARPPRKGEKQSPAYALRMLPLELLENRERLTCYQEQRESLLDNLGRKVRRPYPVPATNNATENAIGRGGKIRVKRMRTSNAPIPSCPFSSC